MMMSIRFYPLAFFMLLSIAGKSQTEIPASAKPGKIMQQGSMCYFLNTDNIVQWSALKIAASDIENHVYIPMDSELFRECTEKSYPKWPQLEKQIQMWALEYDSIFVLTGKTVIDTFSTQACFYKAVLKGCKGDAIGFMMKPNETPAPLMNYAVAIDSLEILTGMDFFPRLDKGLQEIIESDFNPQFWPLSFE